MGTQDNGLTLEGLAHKLETLQRESDERLETLERENERMRSENAGLRQEVSALRSSGTRRGEEVPALRSPDKRGDDEASASETAGLVSRRALLTKAGAAAVAAVAAGTLLKPREARAHNETELLSTSRIQAHWAWLRNHIDQGPAVDAEATTDGDFAGVEAKNFGSGPGVRGTSETAAVEGIATGLSGTGVEGKTQGSNGTGVRGTGRHGVWGESNQAGFYGVTGRNTRTDGTGVRGIGAKNGVLGESTGGGIGVYGKGKHGLYGVSSTAGAGAVEGHNTGGGHGVGAVGQVGLLAFSHTDGWSGAWGRHTGNGFGVAGDSVRGTGVHGFSNNGYGGQFNGGKAQLRIVPKGTAGKPTTGAHAKGEIYMDSAGTLFVCTVGGTPGTWRRVATAVT